MKLLRSLLCLPCAVLWAQPPVVIQSETKVVLVDAVVTGKKGEYIHDLTAKDFHVWEDNKEQTIQSFTLESAGSDPAAAAARASYLILVFDYPDMDPGSQILARQSAARFIDANTGPDHLVAVANFDGGFHIMQSFTGNAGRLKDAIAAKSTVSLNNATSGTSASADLSARDVFRSLRSLAVDLNSVPGRKTIVLMTGSLALANDQRQALTSAIDACNKSNVAVYPIDVRDPSAGGAFDAETGGRGTGTGRGGVTAVGGRGGRGGPQGDADPTAALDPGGASQQALFALAGGTGGFVIRNANELPDGMQKIEKEQEEYYVLGYTPPPAKDGVCHTLRVKVDRGGTSVRARTSYCTGKAQDVLAGTSAEKNLENRAAADKAGNISASMTLPFFYVSPSVARVNLAMEISLDAMKLEHKNNAYHAEINFLGIAALQGQEGGDTGARFSDTLTFNFDDAEFEKRKQQPLHYEKEFRIAPGQYKFTIVFSSGGESFGKLEQPLVIEPRQAGHLALSGVAFSREVHKPSDSGTALFEDRTQLIAQGVQFTPAGSNVFAKAEQVFCYFEVYTPDPANPGSMGVRILDGKTDELKWDGGGMKLDALAGVKSTIPVGLSLSRAALGAGSYKLEITAEDAAGKSVKRTANFELR